MVLQEQDVQVKQLQRAKAGKKRMKDEMKKRLQEEMKRDIINTEQQRKKIIAEKVCVCENFVGERS